MLFLRALLVLVIAPPCSAAVTLGFHVTDGRAPLDPGTPGLVSVGANTLSLTRMSALISEVAFIRLDGTEYRLEDQFGAIDLASGRSTWELHDVPKGHYASLRFLVGLLPGPNHSDPAIWAPDHALNPLVNGLHWNWQGGYVFLALEGRYIRPDATRGGWSFHLATDPRLMRVELTQPFLIDADTRLDLRLDLARVFQGVTLTPDGGGDTTHSATNDPLADKLVANLPTAFLLTTPESPSANPPSTPAPPPEPAAATTSPSGTSGEPPPGKATKRSATPHPFTIPSGFPQVALPPDNPLTVEGIELGRRLFHDPRLSGDGTQSCASCHAPENAFSDTVALSLGIDGLPGLRNSMPLFNLAWSPRFAWDGAQTSIRDQAFAAVVNPLEMRSDPSAAAALIAQDPALVSAFAAAFGDPSVNGERMLLAIEQFLLSLVSADSRFDRAQRGEIELTAAEQEGFALFMTESDIPRGLRGADCFHCHGGSLFTDYQFKNNGLDLHSADPGLAAVNGRDSAHGKFKTPSLRNVALTGPYMHDGRFKTLEEVVAHYNHGVKRADTLDPNLAKHPDSGLALTPDEQSALILFLHTLTDSHLVQP